VNRERGGEVVHRRKVCEWQITRRGPGLGMGVGMETAVRAGFRSPLPPLPPPRPAPHTHTHSHSPAPLFLPAPHVAPSGPQRTIHKVSPGHGPGSHGGQTPCSHQALHPQAVEVDGEHGGRVVDGGDGQGCRCQAEVHDAAQTRAKHTWANGRGGGGGGTGFGYRDSECVCGESEE
jgi:hypothetical protein